MSERVGENDNVNVNVNVNGKENGSNSLTFDL